MHRGLIMKQPPNARLILALAGTALWLLGSGCAATDLVAAFRPVSSFRPWPGEPRIRFETGAEALAKAAADSLPAAISRIERAQGRPFAKPPQIYICGSVASFARHAGGRSAAGQTTFRKRIFISPKPEDTPARMPRLIAHELSHLQLSQQLGLLQTMRLPVWFKEGLAVYVSRGGGAEDVSPAEAAGLILSGRHFTPRPSGSLLSRGFGASAGVSVHALYRQSAMFVQFLHDRDPAGFQAMLLGVEDGRSLAGACRKNLGTDVATAWHDFLASLSAPVEP